MYTYAFEFYPKNLMIMTGKVYILAHSIDQALKNAREYFPNHDIISYGKVSDKQMTLDEFDDFVKEKMEEE